MPFVIRYVPGQYKTQEMCDKIIPQKVQTLTYVPDYNKIKKICNKSVDKYVHVLEFVLNC